MFWLILAFIDDKMSIITSIGDNKMNEENEMEEIELTIPDWDLIENIPDAKRYVGKYVSVVEGKIIAIGDSGREVYLKALKKRKDPKSIPFVIRIPEGGPTLLAAS